ncbi:MAG: lamin tail domain-containing protein, partial [Bellilinea sp.]
MKSTVRVWNVFMAFALMLGVLLATPRQTAVQAAGPAELFFSEYVEGSSNNKALEIYNGTGAAVDLAAGGYNIQMFFNGNPVAGLTINLTGTVADGDVYVLAHSSAVAVILAQADQTNGAGWFNGNDAVALRKGTTIIDVIGQIGYDPGSQWGTDLTSTADNTLRRKPTVLAGDPDGSNAFDPTLEWIGYANNTFDGLGSHTVELPVETAPFVATTSPANGATNVPVSSDITITFSEPVNIIDPWFDLTCSTSGTVLADVSGGPTIFTLDPVADFVNETCTLTVYAAQV